MKALIGALAIDFPSQKVYPSALAFYNDDGTIVEDASGLVAVNLSVVDDQATYQSSIISAIMGYAVAQGYSVTDYIWGIGMTGLAVSRSFSNPSLAINTARQASTTRDAFVSASVDVTASLSLTTGQKGTVTLQYADDSGFTTNVKTVQPMSNGNTGTLAIGLALGQMVTATVSGIVPAAKYYRLLTTNNTGTPTYGTPAIQEVLL